MQGGAQAGVAPTATHSCDAGSRRTSVSLVPFTHVRICNNARTASWQAGHLLYDKSAARVGIAKLDFPLTLALSPKNSDHDRSPIGTSFSEFSRERELKFAPFQRAIARCHFADWIKRVSVLCGHCAPHTKKKGLAPHRAQVLCSKA